MRPCNSSASDSEDVMSRVMGKLPSEKNRQDAKIAKKNQRETNQILQFFLPLLLAFLASWRFIAFVISGFSNHSPSSDTRPVRTGAEGWPAILAPGLV